MNINQELNQKIESVLQAARQPRTSYYALGLAIIECYRIWKQENDVSADSTGFADFCESTLHLSGAFCLCLCDVIGTFDRDDIEAIGFAKLGLLLKVPEDQRNALLADVRKGASYTQLARRVA